MNNTNESKDDVLSDIGDLIYRLRRRADIRDGITSRRSVQEGVPDRLCELLRESAAKLEQLEIYITESRQIAQCIAEQLEQLIKDNREQQS